MALEPVQEPERRHTLGEWYKRLRKRQLATRPMAGGCAAARLSLGALGARLIGIICVVGTVCSAGCAVAKRDPATKQLSSDAENASIDDYPAIAWLAYYTEEVISPDDPRIADGSGYVSAPEELLTTVIRNDHFCGATIVRHDAVLTSAHCVAGLRAGWQDKRRRSRNVAGLNR